NIVIAAEEVQDTVQDLFEVYDDEDAFSLDSPLRELQELERDRQTEDRIILHPRSDPSKRPRIWSRPATSRTDEPMEDDEPLQRPPRRSQRTSAAHPLLHNMARTIDVRDRAKRIAQAMSLGPNERDNALRAAIAGLTDAQIKELRKILKDTYGIHKQVTIRKYKGKYTIQGNGIKGGNLYGDLGCKNEADYLSLEDIVDIPADNLYKDPSGFCYDKAMLRLGIQRQIARGETATWPAGGLVRQEIPNNVLADLGLSIRNQTSIQADLQAGILPDETRAALGQAFGTHYRYGRMIFNPFEEQNLSRILSTGRLDHNRPVGANEASDMDLVEMAQAVNDSSPEDLQALSDEVRAVWGEYV
ncbi:MAG: hypothetical protein ACPHF2_10390, partial [Crocinitomicaceae bacterium]